MKATLKIFILSISLFILSVKTSAQYTQDWISNYTGAGNNIDNATDIVLDNSGNVYVAGYSTVSTNNTDYVTIKYNPSGVQQWVATYNGPGNDLDEARGIVVDNAGNVYVTGMSYVNSISSDYVTIKYNSAGVQQWTVNYNGPGNGNDGAASIVIDGSNNIYITGYSGGSGGASDFATVKYNSSGVQQWASRYTGPGNVHDNARTIKVDAAGNVYVAGEVGLSGTGYDYATVKYNSAGVQQWVSTYTSPGAGTGRDGVFSIDVDVSGNVYVTGSSVGSGSGSDFATIKYNSTGVQQWVTRYNGTGNSNDDAYSLAVDNFGNVYVTGYSTSTGTGIDYATIKYNPSGVQQWVATYNGPGNTADIAYSLAIDTLGNTYITGASAGSGTSNDIATIMYNSSGVEQWTTRYNGPPGNGLDKGNSLVLDGSGKIYVTGASTGIGTGQDFATIKYTQSVGIQQIDLEIPKSYSLMQNYPNPFNPTTIIEFSVPKSAFVKLTVFDVSGRELETLVSQNMTAGTYKADWDASKYSSGVYFYRLETEGFSKTSKMILVK